MKNSLENMTTFTSTRAHDVPRRFRTGRPGPAVHRVGDRLYPLAGGVQLTGRKLEPGTVRVAASSLTHREEETVSENVSIGVRGTVDDVRVSYTKAKLKGLFRVGGRGSRNGPSCPRGAFVGCARVRSQRPSLRRNAGTTPRGLVP